MEHVQHQAPHKFIRYEDRLFIKENLGVMPKQEIADELHMNLATLYIELRRGNNNGVYDPDTAQKGYRQKKNKLKENNNNG